MNTNYDRYGIYGVLIGLFIAVAIMVILDLLGVF